MQNTNVTTSDTETLQRCLMELNQAKKELESIRDKLGSALHDVNKTLDELGINWSEQREKSFTDLIQQLKDHNIVLTEDEKNMLRYSSSTASSIAQTREGLEKLKINIPNKASDFTIVACGAVAAALSRTLQKAEETYSMVKKLKVVGEESDDIAKFKAQCKEQFEEITKVATELKNKATAIHGLLPEQQEKIEKIEASVSALKLEKEAAAAQPKEEVAQTFE